MSQRNAPCSCGSGKKFKVCCGVDGKKRTNWRAAAVVALFVIAAGWALSTALIEANGERQLPEGWEWNEDHGHPHKVAGGPAPFVEPPAGSTWSAEHGHFHGPDGNPIGGGATATPESIPPAN